MIDERELLERAAARYTPEPGIVERIYRRRDRQRRQQRIAAFGIALAVAIAGLGVAIRIFEAAERPKPAGPGITTENVRYLTQSWSAPLTGPAYPVVADGTVYVVDPDAHQLLAFAEGCGDATCTPAWTARIDGYVSAGPIVDRGMVFLVAGQEVVAYETGCGSAGARCAPTWTAPIVVNTRYGVSLAAADGAVWVETQSDPPGPITAYRADCGRGGSTCAPWWRSDRLSAPLVVDGRLYVRDRERLEAFSTDCEPLAEGCDPIWTWQPPGSGWVISATGRVVLATSVETVSSDLDPEVYAIPSDCGSSCAPSWRAQGSLLGMSEPDGLAYVTSQNGVDAYCLDCTDDSAHVFHASLPDGGSQQVGTSFTAVGAGGAVLTGDGVAGLVPSDCAEACKVAFVNTGLFSWSDALAVSGGVAFVASSRSEGVLLAYDLSCGSPCAPVWVWEAGSMRHGVGGPVFDGTSMFFVDAGENASTLRAFRVGKTPQPGVPSTWAADRNGVVEHPGEGGILAMSEAQRMPGTYDLDLETGQLGPTGGRSDLWLDEEDRTTRALKDDTEVGLVKFAYLGQVDFGAISARDLESLAWTDHPIRGTDDARNQLVPGAVFAVRTIEGNYSKVQVLPDDGYDLWLRWVTYEGDSVP